MTQRIKELLDSDFSAASALGEEIRRRVSSGDFEWATLLGTELARRAAREGEDSSEHAFCSTGCRRPSPRRRDSGACAH
ncbi:hypothetical protein ABZV80_42260 [Streptomyces sp. NPDC005132]|uniref:hypothetical protein n=1 Tax=Streptomyces sp. NPDC005132 TaxID=3154294 RepID=UPI0033A31382